MSNQGQFLLSNSAKTFINDFGDEEEIYIIYHLNKNAELTGGVIEDAQVRIAQSGVTAGQPIVQMEMRVQDLENGQELQEQIFKKELLLC
ncbi:MAG: hypothetical protein Ct9H90mP15_01130 [Candidatus Neomarinimicrobiota bacterium]|nr:MAG: hypothetical protein Ct9H90mP15_01130 [Candidatus Neomarinimicrobiota bacterium]